MEQQLELFPVEKKKRVWVEQLKLFPEYEQKYRVKAFREKFQRIIKAQKNEKDEELLVLIDKFIVDVKRIMDR
jgi:hypothetical protein